MNKIQSEIIQDIRSARKSIKVAVSWLTDLLLIKELISAREKGIDVIIIVSSNELNIMRYELFQDLIDIGGIVNKEGSEESEQGNFMHYKFYIIDDEFAKSGSYNWSINATTNREALDKVPVSGKLEQFDNCFKTSVYFFKDIANPSVKKAELLKIEKEKNRILTPEVLAAHRQVQIILEKEEKKHKKEIEKKEYERKEALAIAAKEKAAREKAMEEQQARLKQGKFSVKNDAPPVSEAPPRSYADED